MTDAGLELRDRQDAAEIEAIRRDGWFAPWTPGDSLALAVVGLVVAIGAWVVGWLRLP